MILIVNWSLFRFATVFGCQSRLRSGSYATTWDPWTGHIQSNNDVRGTALSEAVDNVCSVLRPWERRSKPVRDPRIQQAPFEVVGGTHPVRSKRRRSHQDVRRRHSG
jgi:hypothetical protein